MGVAQIKIQAIQEAEKYIRNNLTYNPTTGKITRKDRKNSKGSIDHYGYLILKIKGKQYKSHRVAWFIYYDEWPERVIDHINGIKTDNRLCNLRDVTQCENVQNTTRLPNKKTGVVGVHKDCCTRGLKAVYTTRISGKTYRFRTLLDAVKLRQTMGART